MKEGPRSVTRKLWRRFLIEERVKRCDCWDFGEDLSGLIR